MSEILTLTAWHALVAVLPLVAAALVAVGVANLVTGHVGRVLARIIVILGGLPVVAVWVILPLITGRPLMTVAHLEIALAIVALGIIHPAARRVAGRRDDQAAARALGIHPVVRLWRGLRVRLIGLAPACARAWAVVVTGVTLAAVLDDGASQGLGRAMVEGWRAGEPEEIVIATVAVILLVAVGELLLRVAARAAGIREVR